MAHLPLKTCQNNLSWSKLSKSTKTCVCVYAQYSCSFVQILLWNSGTITIYNITYSVQGWYAILSIILACLVLSKWQCMELRAKVSVSIAPKSKASSKFISIFYWCRFKKIISKIYFGEPPLKKPNYLMKLLS